MITKSIKLYILLIAVIFSSSCNKDFLDKQADDMLTIDQIFANQVETERYLRNVYSYLPDELTPYNTYFGVSDEGDMPWSNMPQNTQMNTGSWSPVAVPFNDYAPLYRGIRSATVFINRVEECTACDSKRWAAEARSLRAWYYFLLLRKYGPVVLVKDLMPVDAQSSELQFPRSSYDECVDYIIQELSVAQADLPQKITNSRDLGKIDSRAVQAMKSRILLYAASPLWNGNADLAGFKNKDGKQLVNPTYDSNKWKKAADAAKAVIDIMPEGLYKKNVNNVFDPFVSYRDLFLDRFNYEVIWARADANSWELQKHLAPRQLTGWNGMAPTQMQVDSYYMANGKMINESGSGYVENGFSSTGTQYTAPGDWNMYVGREPRFYTSILYNRDIWPFTDEGEVQVQLYSTGTSGRNGSHDHSETGYLLQKYLSPNSNVRTGQMSMTTYIFFRLAEMYLNYAEALNEYNPGNPDIKKYIDLIHERAGIPGLPAGLNQAEMRNRIRLERRIELAFENHRVFDTRRWKIAEQTDGGPMWGMNTGAGTSFSDASFYQRTVFETRVFQSKHYLWPIPQSEMDRNKEMVQNPGW
ncbi:MAG: RagB/SusD family nutrient uptake outer membrane protein [Sphingobacteriaceae bacterium]|nr:RagB/SusD family nutrient uptake outer membrane protein [Sphingobacteriaceae bacterium]